MFFDLHKSCYFVNLQSHSDLFVIVFYKCCLFDLETGIRFGYRGERNDAETSGDVTGPVYVTAICFEIFVPLFASMTMFSVQT